MKLEEHPKLLAGGLAVLGVLFLAGGAGVGVYHASHIRGYFARPAEIKPDELVAVSDPRQLPNRWVRFRPSEVRETGLHVSTVVSGQAKARFVLLEVNGYHLVAKVPVRQVSGQVDGHVSVWSTPLSPEVEAVTQIRQKYPTLKLLPFQLDTDNPAPREGGVVLAVVGLLALVGLVCFLFGGALAFAPARAAAAVAAAPSPQPARPLRR